MIGWIYKIELNDEIYIGSTVNLRIRTNNHNSDIKNRNYKLYKYCRANNIEQIDLIPIEEVEYETVEELWVVEEIYRKRYATLNGKKCYMSKEEKREYYLVTNKNYKQNNKEKTKETNKNYYKKNKVKISEYSKEYNKIYKQKNKEKLSERAKEKIQCEICGLVVRRDGIARHKKTPKCTNYL